MVILIRLMIKSHWCAAAHKQVAVISQKQAIYDKFVQLKEF